MRQISLLKPVRGLTFALASLFIAACGEQISVTFEPEIRFVDVTDGSGLEYTGESYGASWGYANDDVLPDLFVNHHRNPAGMYINLGDGTFEDRAYEIDAWQELPTADHHGGAWADFDNDGDQDLLISVGANSPTQFLLNTGSYLFDGIDNYSFDRPAWGGRMPIWFDFTNDGLLDFGMGVSGEGALFQLHEQVGSAFARRNFHSQHQCTNNNYAHLADVTNDGTLDWICVTQRSFPDRVYDYSVGLPFADRTSLMPSIPNVIDSAVADFNGDLLMDFFGLRGRIRWSGAKVVDEARKHIEAQLIDGNGGNSGFTFRTTGEVTFELHTTTRNAAEVFIGEDGWNPPFPGPRTPITFTLSPHDPNVVGLVDDFGSKSDQGVFIGFDPEARMWSVYNWTIPEGNTHFVYIYVETAQPIWGLTEENLKALDKPRQPILLQQSSGTFVDATIEAGIYIPIGCVSVVAADFDNDMDMDLYLACRDDVVNSENMLLQNNGKGEFYPIPFAGGAAGPVGPGVGLSESVVASDFDVDGFVDVFVTNGLRLYPELKGYEAGGPDKLFRNLGNNYHWIELDLVGTNSNRDGIGAVVTVTAGGVMQRKELSGGYHRWSQDDKRLHFGLASHKRADIEVRWPSGAVDTHTRVSANELYEIVEGGSITSLTVPTSTPPSVCGSTAGAPVFDPAVDEGFFVWKDSCGSDSWHIVVSGGAEPAALSFDGRIASDMDYASVTARGLEPSDIVDSTSNPGTIEYHLEVGPGGTDAIDFTAAEGATVCIGVGSNVPTAFAGHDRTPLAMPFDIDTLAPCTDTTPYLVIEDASATENDAAGVITFEVRLTTTSGSTVTVDYETLDGNATAGSDFVYVSDVLTFAPGELVQTIEIPLIDDTMIEATETFTVRLSNAANAAVGYQNSAIGTILDDEPSACDAPTYDRATEQAVFIWQNCTTGQWFTRATAGTSFAEFVGSVQSSAPFVSVTPFSIEGNDVLDNTSDPSRIDFVLKAAAGGQDGFDFEISDTTCFVLESPDVPIYAGVQRNLVGAAFDIQTLGLCQNITPRIDVGDATAAENVAGGILSLPVSLSAATGNTVSVSYATADQTAVAPADYLSTSGTIQFAPGETSATVDIQLVDDQVAEADETFTVTLSSPSNGVLGAAEGVGTIYDNEVAVGVSVADASAPENGTGSSVDVNVTLSEPSTFTVTVDYATADATAAAPDDYLATSGTLTFPPGEVSQTIAVTLIDDDLAEGDEIFSVNLSNAFNSVLVDGVGIVTIGDDEPSPCGAPVYDKASENAIFVWKDCGTDLWHARMAAGGVQTQWIGNVTATAVFPSVVGFSIEANDVLDFTTDPAIIDFVLNANNAGQDGFDFEVAAGSDACFDLSAPAGMAVFVGESRNPVATRFSLATLEACP